MGSHTPAAVQERQASKSQNAHRGWFGDAVSKIQVADVADGVVQRDLIIEFVELPAVEREHGPVVLAGADAGIGDLQAVVS